MDKWDFWGRVNGQTYIHMDGPSYRDARTHLKIKWTAKTVEKLPHLDKWFLCRKRYICQNLVCLDCAWVDCLLLLNVDGKHRIRWQILWIIHFQFCYPGEGELVTKQAVFPVPIPLFVPSPVAMWSTPTPYPIFMPIPIPVPIFIPTTKKSANSIMKHVKEIQEKVPAGDW